MTPPDIHALAEYLMQTGVSNLSTRERRVLERLASRVHHRQLLDAGNHLTLGERLSDSVARLGGSWSFICAFICFLIAYACFNVAGTAALRFDPFPFIFLNLMLSMLAALQAPIIMMSQNRQAARDRLAAARDYEVNLKAESDIIALHEKIDVLRERELTELVQRQQAQLDMLLDLVRRLQRAD
jgi:uncharacterized membrane protein